MRSSKHQTRASTDTRSLATAFIGGFRRPLCAQVCTLRCFRRSRCEKKARWVCVRRGPASVAGRTSV
jgi:hypothetical protein